jgi:hypothetical protein
MGLGSGIRKKSIPDPGSRGQKGTGSRILIRNTDLDLYVDPALERRLSNSLQQDLSSIS